MLRLLVTYPDGKTELIDFSEQHLIEVLTEYFEAETVEILGVISSQSSGEGQ